MDALPVDDRASTTLAPAEEEQGAEGRENKKADAAAHCARDDGALGIGSAE